VAWTHARAFSKLLYAEIVIEVIGDIALQMTQGIALSHLALKLHAELPLVGRPPQEQHQPARDRQRYFATEIGFHQRQRQIDTCGYAGGGVDASIAHVDRIGVHIDLGIASGEFSARRPVRRRAPSVQQARGGKQECPGADTDHALRLPGKPTQRGQ
jgi:hypothetical protein